MELNLVQSVTEFVISAPEDEEPGQKEICSNFDDIIISCVQGVCKNVTDVYREVKRELGCEVARIIFSAVSLSNSQPCLDFFHFNVLILKKNGFYPR